MVYQSNYSNFDVSVKMTKLKGFNSKNVKNVQMTIGVIFFETFFIWKLRFPCKPM